MVLLNLLNRELESFCSSSTLINILNPWILDVLSWISRAKLDCGVPLAACPQWEEAVGDCESRAEALAFSHKFCYGLPECLWDYHWGLLWVSSWGLTGLDPYCGNLVIWRINTVVNLRTFPEHRSLCQRPAALGSLSQAGCCIPDMLETGVQGSGHFNTAIFDRKKPNLRLFSWGRSQDNTIKAGEVKCLCHLGFLIPSRFLAQWAHMSVFRRNPSLRPREQSALQQAGGNILHLRQPPTVLCVPWVSKGPNAQLSREHTWEPHFSPNIPQGITMLFSSSWNYNTCTHPLLSSTSDLSPIPIW